MSNPGSLLHFGDFEADLATGELRTHGQTVKLQPQPFRLLAFLLERHWELVTRQEIHQKLWGNDTFVDFEQGLNFAIKKIREALGDNADCPRYIETLPRRGYRFIAPVERLPGLTVASDDVQAPGTEGRVISISEGLHEAARVEGSSALAVATSPETGVPPADGTAVPVAAAPPYRSDEQHRRTMRRRWLSVLVSIAAVTFAAAGYLYIHRRSIPKLTDKDTIVVADFTNTTGDPVFDGTLRQGLSAQLEQSPFLNLLSDGRIAETLGLMGQDAGAHLTKALAREVCRRTSSRATIEGSIAPLGSQYAVALQAVNCQDGDVLAEEQAIANNKEQVLDGLGKVTTKMRQELGESLASVEKFDVPLKNVTTPSLEALQAYTLAALATNIKQDYGTGIPLLQRAVSLDPKFAMAYAGLGVDYLNQGQTDLASENFEKARQLGDRLSAHERFSVDSLYEWFVTGDLLAARKSYELWEQLYPRSFNERQNLGAVYGNLGDYKRALATFQQALKSEPEGAMVYDNLAMTYQNLDRLDEAKATAQEARIHHLDGPQIHLCLYAVDFLEHDAPGMEHEAAGLIGKPGIDDVILNNESSTEAYAGKFAKARELSRRAVGSAVQSHEEEPAASYKAGAAFREALVGNFSFARQQARSALALSKGRDVEAISAIALALAGNGADAMHLDADLSKRFPQDTVVQFEYLPMIRAARILGGDDPTKLADPAILALVRCVPYELGSATNLYPVFLRGEGYLAAQQGPAAVAEFQKVLGHPGIVVNDPIGALAHLGLARHYALEAGVPVAAVDDRRAHRALPGEAGAHRAPLQPESLAKARIAYQDFLALWKDADPDIPILKQAKAEYARLQ